MDSLFWRHVIFFFLARLPEVGWWVVVVVEVFPAPIRSVWCACGAVADGGYVADRAVDIFNMEKKKNNKNIKHMAWVVGGGVLPT
jgi:hypothetical protein